jgi:hypothetical protein
MTDNGHPLSQNGHNPEPDLGASEDWMPASELQTEMAAFESRLKAAYVRAPEAAVAEAHVEAMLAEADAIAATAVLAEPTERLARAPRSRWVAVRRLALVPLGVLALGGGLAVAGVRPPEPISDVFESVGIDVPGSDEERSDGAGDGKAIGDEAKQRNGQARETSGSGANTTNDGATPGAAQANPDASEGQETAEQARSGQTPPEGPGRSDDHPAPQGSGTPPEDPGHPGEGKPDSPPGQSHSSAAEHGGGIANMPDNPGKPETDEKDKLEK